MSSLTAKWEKERLCTEAWLVFIGSARGFVRQPAYCVWPAGTGTADPPLTPGGVYRALEEQEGRVKSVGAMAVTARGTYHFDRKRGGQKAPLKFHLMGFESSLARKVDINFALSWHQVLSEHLEKAFSKAASQPVSSTQHVAPYKDHQLLWLWSCDIWNSKLCQKAQLEQNVAFLNTLFCPKNCPKNIQFK